MNARHDASYKHLFSSPKVVQHLIEGFLLDKGLEGLERLDFATLERVPASYVSDDLRQRADDVIWRIKTDKDWLLPLGHLEQPTARPHGGVARCLQARLSS